MRQQVTKSYYLSPFGRARHIELRCEQRPNRCVEFKYSVLDKFEGSDSEDRLTNTCNTKSVRGFRYLACDPMTIRCAVLEFAVAEYSDGRCPPALPHPSLQQHLISTS